MSINPVFNNICQNSTNNTSAENKTTAANTATPENKNKKSVAIGMSIIGTTLLAGLIATGRYKKINTLADKIEFTPAKTIEEAREFAKKHLHIKKYELTDVNIANYVNEALCEFNNKSTKHKRMISKICAKINESDLEALAGIRSGKIFRGELTIVEKNIKKLANITAQSISEKDKKLLESEYASERIKNLYSKLISNTDELTFGEKIELSRYLERHSSVLYGGYSSIFANMLADKKVIKYLEDNKISTSLQDFMKLDSAQQKNIIKQIRSNTGYVYKCYDSGPYDFINHELGHMLHKENIGAKRFNAIEGHNSTSEKNAIKEELNNAIQDPFKRVILDNVSIYSVTSDLEFVAETYAGLKNGNKFCKEIMDKYIKLGGVLP